MKIMGKVLLLVFITGGLTAILLFVTDHSYAQQAALYLTNLPGGLEENEVDNTKEAGIEKIKKIEKIEKEETAVSVETSKQQIAASAKSKTQQSKKTAKKKTAAYYKVSKNYFSDAVFIGDSRTVGMYESQLLPDATYYAKVGIGIGGILAQRFIEEGGTTFTLEEALSRNSFGKVYIMIGINDMSSGDVDWFTEKYREILRIVRMTQPDAVIYIQGNIPMGYDIQDLSGSLNNENLNSRNEASRQLADGKHIFYLEIEDIYADANGHLNSYFSSDGLHVRPNYYPLWVDFLLHHAVVRG